MAHIFSPLRRMPMALLWSGLSLSAIGDQLYTVALTWIAVGVLGPKAGYLAALQSAVMLLVVLGIGRWADRWHPRWAMVAADLSRACVLVAIVASWLVAGAPNAAHLVLAVVVLAIGQAIFQPALQSVLPALVDDKHLLPAANGLLDMTDRSARLLGPGLIGLLAGLVPVVHFLSLDAASFFASAIAILLIGRISNVAIPKRAPTRESIAANFSRGVRAMQSHALLGYLFKTAGPLNGAWYAAFYLGLPLLIAQHHVSGPGGSGLGAFGLVISAYGSTNLAANVVFGSRMLPARPQIQIFAGNAIAGLGMVMLGLASLLPQAWILPGLMAAAALGAIGGPMKDIPQAVLRQTRLAHADMAAAMRAYMATTSAGMLAAMLLAPSAIAWLGVVVVIAGAGGSYLLAGLIGWLRFSDWRELSLLEQTTL